MNPYRQELAISHFWVGVFSCSSVRFWLLMSTTSTVSPSWCSLVPGTATTVPASCTASSWLLPAASSLDTLLSNRLCCVSWVR